jgi:hypothetical protein
MLFAHRDLTATALLLFLRVHVSLTKLCQVTQLHIIGPPDPSTELVAGEVREIYTPRAIQFRFHPFVSLESKLPYENFPHIPSSTPGRGAY